jgi:hypothetical protein
VKWSNRQNAPVQPPALDVPILALFVHPTNERAIKAWEWSGFQRFSKTYTDPKANVTYISMIRSLRPAPAG